MFVVAAEILGCEMFHGDSCKLHHKCHVPTKTRYLALNELLNDELFSSAFICLIENHLESKNITFLCYCSSVFPGGPSSRESTCNAGDLGSIPGWGGSPGEGKGKPLQCSCLEDSMDRGAWRATVHGLERVRHDLATEQQYMCVPCCFSCVQLFATL